MPSRPYRQRLLAMIDALPQELPILSAPQRSHPNEALASIELLAIELTLQAQTYCLVHCLAPELEATAVLECRLGPPPEDKRRAIYRRMLELNLHTAAVHPFGLSIDAARGEVVMSSPLNLQQASAADLAALISATVQIATAWRATGFLDVPLTNPAAVSDEPPADTSGCVRA
jgi:hypothetical protein